MISSPIAHPKKLALRIIDKRKMRLGPSKGKLLWLTIMSNATEEALAMWMLNLAGKNLRIVTEYRIVLHIIIP